jgi:hypothetical protein
MVVWGLATCMAYASYAMNLDLVFRRVIEKCTGATALPRPGGAQCTAATGA